MGFGTTAFNGSILVLIFSAAAISGIASSIKSPSETIAFASIPTSDAPTVSFAGQNYGARKIKRIAKTALICELTVTVVGIILCAIVLPLAPVLLNLYSKDPVVIQYGVDRLEIICTTYFLCGMMDVMVGILRGMGFSIAPMIVSLTGVCAFRVVWIYTIFAKYRTLDSLYLSYPVTWATTFFIQLMIFIIVYKRLRKRMPE